MKQTNKQKLPFIVLFALIVFTLIGMLGVAWWVEYYNQKERVAVLSESVYDGSQFVFPEFTVQIKPRGGDTGSWYREYIYDEEGKVLYRPSVGTIYEITLTNTSTATITDWELGLEIPEFLWLNNAWNGTMEMHQNVDGETRVQEFDLREYTQTEITLDYSIDHSGLMIPMNPGDRFIYHPSTEYKEMPLAPTVKMGEEKSALVGFIIYIPDQTQEYVTNFDKGMVRYHLHINVWDLPIFILLIILLLIYGVILLTLLVSQIRINKLLEEQKRDAQIIEQSISTFINFIEAKDPHTKGHSERVAKYSYLIAQRMGYSALECNRIYYIALMHDCGKISVPVTILQKPSRLTDEEYEEIKTHTTYGNKMLRDFTSIEGISLGALYHHERYDGKGYPAGLAGEAIPLIARIICVADSLDAMNSNRCYRPRLTKEDIIKELFDNKGKQFDPVVVDHVIKLIVAGEIEFS